MEDKKDATPLPTMKAVPAEDDPKAKGDAGQSEDEPTVEDTLIDNSPLIIPPSLADATDEEDAGKNGE